MGKFQFSLNVVIACYEKFTVLNVKYNLFMQLQAILDPFFLMQNTRVVSTRHGDPLAGDGPRGQSSHLSEAGTPTDAHHACAAPRVYHLLHLLRHRLVMWYVFI